MSIDEEQKKAAYDEMTNWLKCELKFDKDPSKIVLASEFELHNLHYYVFKYKKNAFSKWMLGVCGGYEQDELTNCGHVYAGSKEYKEKTATSDAIELVEGIRQFYVDSAKRDCSDIVEMQEIESDKENKSIFVGFVLLDEYGFDTDRFKNLFEKEWEYEFCDFKVTEDTISFTCDKCMVVASMVSVPVPNDEATKDAQTSFIWKEAVEVTKTHVAHIILTVVKEDENITTKDVSYVFVKAASTLLKLKNAIAFNYCGTVFEPHFYINASETLKEGDIPLLNLIYFGIYRTKAGINGYTYGLKYFGKKEIEVIGTEKSPDEISEYLYNIAYYVIENDVNLKAGETIGFRADEKFKITLSKGISLDENTLKIGM